MADLPDHLDDTPTPARRAFEAWADKNLAHSRYGLGREEGSYVQAVTRWAFKAWQAATALATNPAAAELAARTVEPPVLYQRRMRPSWLPLVEWGSWDTCSKEEADNCERAPVLGNWCIEVRRLYLWADPAQPNHKALLEIVGCFKAAEIAGLEEALAESTDKRLKDLVSRRLMYALYAANMALFVRP